MDGKDAASYAYYTALATFSAASMLPSNPVITSVARTGILISGMLLCSPADIGEAAAEAREVATKLGTATKDLTTLLNGVSADDWSKMGREAVEATFQSFAKQGTNAENIWQGMAETLDQFNGGTQVLGYTLVSFSSPSSGWPSSA